MCRMLDRRTLSWCSAQVRRPLTPLPSSIPVSSPRISMPGYNGEARLNEAATRLPNERDSGKVPRRAADAGRNGTGYDLQLQLPRLFRRHRVATRQPEQPDAQNAARNLAAPQFCGKKVSRLKRIVLAGYPRADAMVALYPPEWCAVWLPPPSAASPRVPRPCTHPILF